MGRASLCLLVVAACGGASSGPPPAAVRAAISAEAPRASADDLEVARVGDRPVWASCVVAQAQRQHLTREAALDQCVAFELMAQEAERRGLATAPEVVDATKTALVSREIELAFEDTYRTPADLGEFMRKIVDKNAWRMHRPDVRSSAYVRINVPKQATPAQDAQAKAAAQKIADAVVGEPGLLDVHLLDFAHRAAPGVDFAHAEVSPRPREALDPSYGDALYGIPEIGRAVGPVRTPWGYDVILWTGGLPPKETPRAELEAEMFAEVRRGFFPEWVAQLVKEHGIAIETHPEQLEALEP